VFQGLSTGRAASAQQRAEAPAGNNKLNLLSSSLFPSLFPLFSSKFYHFTHFTLKSVLQSNKNICQPYHCFSLIPSSTCLSKYPLFCLSAPSLVASSLSSPSETSTLHQEPTCHTAMHQAVPLTALSPATIAQRLQIAVASSIQEDRSYRPNFGILAHQSGQMILGLCTAYGMLPQCTQSKMKLINIP
jgi:hypothetical protein